LYTTLGIMMLFHLESSLAWFQAFLHKSTFCAARSDKHASKTTWPSTDPQMGACNIYQIVQVPS